MLENEVSFLQKFLDVYKEDQKGSKMFFYQEKLQLNLNDSKAAKSVLELVKDYVMGLQFVLQYYF